MGDNIRVYDIYHDGVNLGFTSPNTVSIPLQGIATDVMSDQVEGPRKVIPRGLIPGNEIPVTLQNSDLDFLIGTLFRGQAETVTSGQQQAMGLGYKLRDAADVVGRLLFHPRDLPLSNTSSDILIHQAYALANVTLASNKEEIQEIAVNFRPIPDNDQPTGFEYGIVGPWNITEATPEFVAILMDREIRHPIMGLRAASLSPGQVDRVTAKKVFLTDSTTTAAIDNVGGYTATDTSIVFDTLSTPFALPSGGKTSYLKNTTTGELMWIADVTYNAGGTSGTLTVVRGVPSGTGLVAADDDVLTLQQDFGAQDARDEAAWAADAARVTVGDTFPGTGTTRKGVLAHVTTGAAVNVDATVNGVTSDDLVVTPT